MSHVQDCNVCQKCPCCVINGSWPPCSAADLPTPDINNYPIGQLIISGVGRSAAGGQKQGGEGHSNSNSQKEVGVEEDLHELGASELQERGISLGCTGPGQQSFSGTRWTIQQNTLGWSNAKCFEAILHRTETMNQDFSGQISYTQYPNKQAHDKEEFGKQYLVCDWQNNSLYKLLYLLVKAANVTVVLCGLLIHLHGLNARVVLGWQCVQD